MANGKAAVGMISSTDYRKTANKGRGEAVKCATDCDACADCEDRDVCKADIALKRVEGQTSMVMRLGVRAQALLAALIIE